MASIRSRRRNRRLRNRNRISRGGRFNVKRLTPRRKAMIERRRRKFFEEDLDLDNVRRNNRKRALYATHYRGKTQVVEKYPEGRTIIDVAEILKRNSNS